VSDPAREPRTNRRHCNPDPVPHAVSKRTSRHPYPRPVESSVSGVVPTQDIDVLNQLAFDGGRVSHQSPARLEDWRLGTETGPTSSTTSAVTIAWISYRLSPPGSPRPRRSRWPTERRPVSGEAAWDWRRPGSGAWPSPECAARPGPPGSQSPNR